MDDTAPRPSETRDMEDSGGEDYEDDEDGLEHGESPVLWANQDV